MSRSTAEAPATLHAGGRVAGDLRPIPEYALAPGRPYSEDPGYWRSVDALMGSAAAQFGRRQLAMLDRLSRGWLRRSGSARLPELDAMAARVARPGVFFLNLNYEWACSVALVGNGRGGVRMFRSLDWVFDGLGTALCVLRRETPHGPYVSLTWPMFVGELTVAAPGRFIIALNNAPVATPRAFGRALPAPVARLITLKGVFGGTALPPAHLLRHVAETAADARQAIDMLMKTPVCRPTIFCVAGPTLGESGVVERQPAQSRFRPAPTFATNHWLCKPWSDVIVEDELSYARMAKISTLDGAKELDDWCVPPILNKNTQYAAQADLSEPELTVVAYSAGRPVTLHTRVTLSA